MSEIKYSSAELMIINAARLLRDGDVVFVGVGQPSLACNLAKRTLAPNLVMIYEAGVIGAEPARLPLSIGDPTIVTGATAVTSMFELFAFYLQAGLIDVAFLGGAQVDRHGTQYDRDRRLPASEGPAAGLGWVIWQVDEVWTINRGVLTIPHDMAFVMDYISGEAERNPVYGAKMWAHDRPIITSDTTEGWPAHVHAFPFGEVWSALSELKPAPVHQEWCINSVAFMLWYAWFIGVKQIRCWGLDYHHHKSGRVEDGHPNVAYWVGRLEAEGLSVVPFDSSTFLDAHNRGFFYGYQRDPRPLAVSRRALFKRLAGLDPPPEEGNG